MKGVGKGRLWATSVARLLALQGNDPFSITETPVERTAQMQLTEGLDLVPHVERER